ncbi:MAG: SRPBCC family protein [Jatrophihabitantaceae bacterium]
MTRWYPLEPCDDTFFDTAPQVYRYPVELNVSPARVWESLTSDGSMADWGLGVKLNWTSPRPFGIGSGRTVVLPARAMTVRERFFTWDEGTRYSFYVEQANRPLLRRFAEDYLIEKTATGSRFTWTIAMEPTAKTARLIGLTSPVNNLLYRAVPIRAKAYFAKHP